ncbi:AraC family transcriptional regulator [Sphingomonas aracearum]|nr:helix-turn-helix domain-containing protein [Sphingomonas aracearum]
MLPSDTGLPGAPAQSVASAIRYDRPDASVADWFTAYHHYEVPQAAADERTSWILPGTAYIRLMLRIDGPTAVTIGGRHIDPVPQYALYGPTSKAMEVREGGGVTIGFGISALGWARLTRWRASDLHNQVTPAERMLGAGVAERLAAELATVPAEQLKPALDRLLPDLLGPPNPDEAILRGLTTMILENSFAEIGEVATRLGVEPHALRRLSLRYFGMTPKVLLRRARFLRSYQRVTRLSAATDYRAIDPSYYDVSHFLRDAHTFLGMTPRHFHLLQRPQCEAALRACMPLSGTAQG